MAGAASSTAVTAHQPEEARAGRSASSGSRTAGKVRRAGVGAARTAAVGAAAGSGSWSRKERAEGERVPVRPDGQAPLGPPREPWP